MSGNAKTGQMTYRTLLYNTLITGLIATCVILAIIGTCLTLTLYGFFGPEPRDNIWFPAIETLLSNFSNVYVNSIILALSFCAPFIARAYPHKPILRAAGWISGTILLTVSYMIISILIPVSMLAILMGLGYPLQYLTLLFLFMFVCVLLYLFLSICAFGETLYIERNPHVLAMWEGWDLRNITISILFPYYIMMACNIAILMIGTSIFT